MSELNIQIIKTIVVILFLSFIKAVISRSMRKISIKIFEGNERKKSMDRVLNFLIVLIGFIVLSVIWGVDRKDFFVFLTSTLTVIGVAFFAQWSIISNVTAGIVVFFNHPIRIGDKIRIGEKDFYTEGTLDKISWFFMHITNEEGEEITIPNNILLQKSVQILKIKKRGNSLNLEKHYSKPSDFPKL
ncbi:MAG: mechanosensitive ion channel [Flavobacteriia bacterium]|nr:mechanosensitive ion channel [Flavobacteriia bacterium]OJX37536.1 MAG: hypothetical protein BGO87_00820 [Flavobacteriia bacterium 40-80]